jgi:hypothetical protein
MGLTSSIPSLGCHCVDGASRKSLLWAPLRGLEAPSAQAGLYVTSCTLRAS